MKISRNIRVLSIMVIFAMLAGCKTNSVVSDKKIAKLLNDPKTYIVDVRTPDEFADGTINGAVNIPHNTIKDNLDKFEGKQQVVVFCKGGKRADIARTELNSNGIKKVFNVGGYERVKSILESSK